MVLWVEYGKLTTKQPITTPVLPYIGNNGFQILFQVVSILLGLSTLLILI